MPQAELDVDAPPPRDETTSIVAVRRVCLGRGIQFAGQLLEALGGDRGEEACFVSEEVGGRRMREVSSPRHGTQTQSGLIASGVSAGSALSGGSFLSFGSFLSALSIGSAGSLLSIGSFGSILSIGSAGGFGQIGSTPVLEPLLRSIGLAF